MPLFQRNNSTSLPLPENNSFYFEVTKGHMLELVKINTTVTVLMVAGS